MQSNIHPVEAEELMAYLDGELPVERAAATAAHLRECRECQIVAAEVKSVSESLTAWDVEPVDLRINPEMAAALEDREGKAQATAPGGRWSWLGGSQLGRLAPWVGGAFAGGVVVLLLISAVVFTSRQTQRGPIAGLQETATNHRLKETLRAPSSGGDRDRLTQFSAAPPQPRAADELAANQLTAQMASNMESTRVTEPPTAPMILRTAQLMVVAQNLDQARAGMDKIVQKYSGYVGDLSVSAPSDGPRKLTATLRVPASQLDTALSEVKSLGRVEAESQKGQDVTAQYVDLQARLSNSRNTEQRLIELLRQRTGKLSDVLEVETELSRVREEIERMEGERRLLAKQVEFATLTATVTEEYKTPARALPDSLGTRFRNAAVDGYQSVVNFVIDVALFLVSSGPMILLWVAILFYPARFAWRKARAGRVPPSPE
jgi:anti-sigma factor RsiW